MKSYNGLYKKCLSTANLVRAMIEAGKNKRKKNKRHQRLRVFRKNAWQLVFLARQYLLNYRRTKHKKVTIYDGISAKKRDIVVPTVEEEIVHHAIVNVLKDIMMPGLYEHTYASIPGRGIHSAARAVKRWLLQDPEGTRYCLKIDIRKFFDSVDQEALRNLLRKRIRDIKFLRLLDEVIYSADSGIPLGFVTSQWFANFLLSELDHKVKEEWRAKHSVRFMDDMAIFGETKEELWAIFEKIRAYVQETLHLDIKDNWQVFPVRQNKADAHGRFLDFLGFKFYREHISLRRKIALRLQRKAQHIHKKDRANIRDARQMVTYNSCLKFVDCHDWYIRRVALYISVRGLRKKISKYDKIHCTTNQAAMAA